MTLPSYTIICITIKIKVIGVSFNVKIYKIFCAIDCHDFDRDKV